MAIKSNMHLYFLHDFDIKIQNGKTCTGLKARNLQLRKTRKEAHFTFAMKKQKLVYGEQLKYFRV